MMTLRPTGCFRGRSFKWEGANPFLSDSGHNHPFPNTHTGDCAGAQRPGSLSSGSISPSRSPAQSACACGLPQAPGDPCLLWYHLNNAPKPLYPSNHWVSMSSWGLHFSVTWAFSFLSQRVTGNRRKGCYRVNCLTPPPLPFPRWKS